MFFTPLSIFLRTSLPSSFKNASTPVAAEWALIAFRASEMFVPTPIVNPLTTTVLFIIWVPYETEFAVVKIVFVAPYFSSLPAIT